MYSTTVYRTVNLSSQVVEFLLYIVSEHIPTYLLCILLTVSYTCVEYIAIEFYAFNQVISKVIQFCNNVADNA